MATTESSLISTAQPVLATATIRRGGLCDLEAVAALSAALQQECRQEQPAPSQRLVALRLDLLAWGGRLLVAEAGDRIVGYCAYNMRQAQLQEIFVDSAFRGHAIGRDLLTYAERDLEHGNVLSMSVPVEHAGESARAFFARQGFCPAAEDALPQDTLPQGWQKAL